MRRGRHFLLAVSIALLGARGASAQVNTEPLRDRIHEKGMSWLLQGVLDGHTGNTRGMTADGLVGGGFATGRHLVFAFASADYSKLNETLGVDKSFAHIRYDYELTSFCWWEFFLQAQSDASQRITIRDLAGTGPRFALYRDSEFKMYLGIAYMFENDVTTPAVGLPGEWQPVTHRASVYLTEHTKLPDNVVTVATIYVQPDILEPSNVRVSVDAGFIFSISKSLSTNVTFSGHYDSRPPSGVLSTDTELKNAITVTW
jgi:hypothetical protein